MKQILLMFAVALDHLIVFLIISLPINIIFPLAVVYEDNGGSYYVFMHVHVCVYECMYAGLYMYVFMHACMHVGIHAHTYSI